MGNQMSVPQRVEDQDNDSERDTYKVMQLTAPGRQSRGWPQNKWPA